VRVCDDGPGMTAAEVEHAFQAFQRLDPRVRDGETGTGLGLPIARKLCELHGGALTLESAPGRGTQAIASFPAARIVLTGG
jgi:signal transduction histidine kinase